MNSRYNKTFYILLTLAAALSVGSCTDTFEGELLSRLPDNMISFEVSSGIETTANTRSASPPEADLSPVVLTEGSDTLYLHRYVAPEAERATGCCAAGNTSRAQEVNDTPEFKTRYRNFCVQATYTDDNKTYIPLSEATPVSADDDPRDVWYIEKPTYYWPTTRQLRFNAYAPTDAKELLRNIDLSQETIAFSYTVPTSDTEPRTDAEVQPDILLASTTCRHTDCPDDLAPLNFRHALSAIKFAVRDVTDGEIVDITIKGVAGSGRCAFNPNVPSTTTPNEEETATTPDAEKVTAFKWTLDEENKATYTQVFNYKTVDTYPNIPAIGDATVINSTMPEKTFMLIPQSIPDDAELIIRFRRDGTETIKTLKGKLKTEDIPLWEAGKEYVYTISTSSENWTYVFEVLGNEEEGTSNIYVYSPNDDKFAEPQNTGYYTVKSYRFRTNNPSEKQILPWTATFDGSESYQVRAEDDVKYNGKYITAAKWISDQNKEQNPLYEIDGIEEDNKKGQFKGIGSESAEMRKLDFYPHYIVTDWKGDETMQNTKPFDDNSKTTPYDLSTFGSGKEEDRSTANCYVVDRPGWYCLPLVYGNAIIKGQPNASGYTSNATTGAILSTFYDYKRQVIKEPYITNGENDETANLMWQDAYNMISDVSLQKVKNADGNEETMLCFFVNKDDLQQGNAIVALRDKDGDIMWSWHIWVTEHWLGTDGKPQILSSNPADFTAKINDVTDIRERGDAMVTQNQEGHTFYMSPYNLGWCDPKNVIYLKRKSRMYFVQYLPDNATETKRTAALDIIQQGETVNYKIGNNTYYQWGRKDPLVGFVDRKKNYKANFGPYDFDLEKGKAKPIEYGIKNPNIMLATNSNGSDSDQNWTTDRYNNLWNNSSTIGIGQSTTLSEDFWTHTKTVYDPCPVGYVTPNAGVWMVLGHVSSVDPWDSNGQEETVFDANINGERGKVIQAEPEGIMYYIIYGTGQSNDIDNYIYLIPTGNRWYSDKHTFSLDESSMANQEKEVYAGLNYNLRMFYSWSSRLHTEYTALTGAIGIDGAVNRNFILTPQFNGRGAMGRPIRPIRDPNF